MAIAGMQCARRVLTRKCAQLLGKYRTSQTRQSGLLHLLVHPSKTGEGWFTTMTFLYVCRTKSLHTLLHLFPRSRHKVQDHIHISLYICILYHEDVGADVRHVARWVDRFWFWLCSDLELSKTLLKWGPSMIFPRQSCSPSLPADPHRQCWCWCWKLACPSRRQRQEQKARQKQKGWWW